MSSTYVPIWLWTGEGIAYIYVEQATRQPPLAENKDIHSKEQSRGNKRHRIGSYPFRNSPPTTVKKKKKKNMTTNKKKSSMPPWVKIHGDA
jgi:hypothetical protein